MNPWIEGRWTWDELRKEHAAGTMIRFENGDELIIGDVNESGGQCNCCCDIHDGDVIVAYRELI